MAAVLPRLGLTGASQAGRIRGGAPVAGARGRCVGHTSGGVGPGHKPGETVPRGTAREWSPRSVPRVPKVGGPRRGFHVERSRSLSPGPRGRQRMPRGHRRRRTTSIWGPGQSARVGAAPAGLVRQGRGASQPIRPGAGRTGTVHTAARPDGPGSMPGVEMFPVEHRRVVAKGHGLPSRPSLLGPAHGSETRFGFRTVACASAAPESVASVGGLHWLVAHLRRPT